MSRRAVALYILTVTPDIGAHVVRLVPRSYYRAPLLTAGLAGYALCFFLARRRRRRRENDQDRR